MKKTAAILIVEDDKWQAEQHERVLTRAGYNTAVALHALAAIEASMTFILM
jgi:PleD family two-component response regulator